MKAKKQKMFGKKMPSAPMMGEDMDGMPRKRGAGMGAAQEQRRERKRVHVPKVKPMLKAAPKPPKVKKAPRKGM